MKTSRTKLKRKYFPSDFEITTWENLEKEFEKLLTFPIASPDELVKFWERVSELDKLIEDKLARLYIAMTRDTARTDLRDAFNRFLAEVYAQSQAYDFRLKRKFYANPFRTELPEKYALLNRIITNDIELFRPENVPLAVRQEELAARYGEIVSQMTVDWDGREKTLPQLAPCLEDQSRTVREKAWRLMFERFSRDQAELEKIFDELKALRIEMARNAGYKNFRDYAHRAKGRFAYAPEDLLALHAAIEKVIVPLAEEFNAERKNKLNLETLKPWDIAVDLEGPLPWPFASAEELFRKSLRTLNRVDRRFGAALRKLSEKKLLDLGNRKGKAPGAYSYPLYETGASFIFANAVGVEQDVRSFLHESGHALHEIFSRRQPLIQYCNKPQEVAELASMGMELLTLDCWDEFYPPEILKTIRKKELAEKITFLPWGVAVDAFQHWVYLHPDHTSRERGEYFTSLLDRFRIGGDWTGLEKEKAMRWLLQHHIFDQPFYYIEYVLAQLGAIALYRNYKKNPKGTIGNYKKFLSLAYTRPVPELYAAAGVPFDFSEGYIAELAGFVRSELEKTSP